MYDEVPLTSMAVKGKFSCIARDGVRHDSRVWFDNEDLIEYTIHSEEYSQTLTVLVLEDIIKFDIADKVEEEDLL